MKFGGIILNFLLFDWSCRSLRHHHFSIRHHLSDLNTRQRQLRANQSLRHSALSYESSTRCSDSFVECFELQNWGLFEHSVLTLGSAPLFAVITGETGSGKSVLISALQYLYSNSGTPQSRRNTRGKGDYFISDSKSNAMSKVTLRRGHEEYTKSYDGRNRKTLCELNGMKITMKAVVGNLRDDVRFWSSESLSLLDSGPEGFVNYVDKNLCDGGNSLLLKAGSAFNEWMKSHEKLSKLKLLQMRKEGNDEMESFSEYLADVALFESKLQKVLSEAFHTLNEINDALYDGTTSAEESRSVHDSSLTSSTTSTSTSTRTSTSTKSTSDAASIDELLKKIKYCLQDSSSSSLSSSSPSSASSSLHRSVGVEHHASDTLSSSSASDRSSSSGSSSSSRVTEYEHVHVSPAMTAWSVALLTIDFLSNLSSALDNTLYSSDKTASNTNANTNSGNNNNKVRNKENAGGKESDFNTIINIIEDQGNKIISLEKEFENLNLKNTNFDMKMESLHNYFQIIEDNVMKVKKEILDMRNSLPVLKMNDVIGKFETLMSESEKLCRRHDVRTYAELQVEKVKWQNDLILMENLIFTLPESEKHELKLRKEYTEIALDLTEMRLSGAHQFINRVNDMLPDLEMGDKNIGVNFLMLAGRNSSTGNGNGKGIISSREEAPLQREGNKEKEEEGGLELAFCNWRNSFFDISDAERRMEGSNNMSLNDDGDRDGDAAGVAEGVQDVDSDGDDNAQGRHMRAKERHEELKRELVSKIADNLSPSGGANGRGWDDIALSVRACRKRNTRKEGDIEAEVNEVPVPVPLMTPMSSLIQIHLESSQSVNLNGDSVDVRMSSEVGVLSSGESTRLALAMETCTHTAPALTTAELSSPLQSEGPGLFFDPQERVGEDAVIGLPNQGTDQETDLVHGYEIRGSVEVDKGRGDGEDLAVTASHPVPVLDGIQVPSDPRSLPVQIRGNQGEGKGRGNGRSFEGLLILDEIDAHIGGEAAVAVAKLLKGQGRWRQVIAVTHNPLLASLADRHYVVSKLTGIEVHAAEGEGGAVGGSSTATAGGGEGEGGKYERGLTEGLRSRSVLSEVRGVARELEISRMATGGGVHSAAGIALARALLSQG